MLVEGLSKFISKRIDVLALDSYLCEEFEISVQLRFTIVSFLRLCNVGLAGHNLRCVCVHFELHLFCYLLEVIHSLCTINLIITGLLLLIIFNTLLFSESNQCLIQYLVFVQRLYFIQFTFSIHYVLSRMLRSIFYFLILDVVFLLRGSFIWMIIVLYLLILCR